jgi:hypothetical protein
MQPQRSRREEEAAEGDKGFWGDTRWGAAGEKSGTAESAEGTPNIGKTAGVPLKGD